MLTAWSTISLMRANLSQRRLGDEACLRGGSTDLRPAPSMPSRYAIPVTCSTRSSRAPIAFLAKRSDPCCSTGLVNLAKAKRRHQGRTVAGSPAIVTTAPTICGRSGTWCRKTPSKADCVALAVTISAGRAARCWSASCRRSHRLTAPSAATALKRASPSRAGLR